MALAEWWGGGRKDGVGPEYCNGCRKTGRPCAQGLPGEGGRLCPEAEASPLTLEGFHVARVCRQFGAWAGGGLGPARLDGDEVRRRLGDLVPDWVADELVDVFEASALASREAASKARKGRDDRNPQPEED